MNKHELKSLLENVRNLLMEGPPGWTPEHPTEWDPTEWMYEPLKPYIPPRPEGWVGDWPFEGWEDIIPPLSRPEWYGRTPIHNPGSYDPIYPGRPEWDRIPIHNPIYDPIYDDGYDTPFTQEEDERYFTDSVEPNQKALNMNKHELKSLLENIYSTLKEDEGDFVGPPDPTYPDFSREDLERLTRELFPNGIPIERPLTPEELDPFRPPDWWTWGAKMWARWVYQMWVYHTVRPQTPMELNYENVPHYWYFDSQGNPHWQPWIYPENDPLYRPIHHPFVEH